MRRVAFTLVAGAAALATARVASAQGTPTTPAVPPAPPTVAPAAPSDSGARPIRLQEAVELAQRNAPATVQARGSLRANQAGVRSAWAAFIPNVNLSSSAVQNSPVNGNINPQTNRATNGRWSLSQGISANVDLFDGGRRFFGLRTANANVNAAQASVVNQNYQLALEVKQQFFAVLAAREAEAAARAQLEEAQQQLRVSRANVLARTATKSDSLRALIQVGNGQLALLTAQNDLQTADASLTRLVATPFTVTASAEDTVGEGTLTIDSASLARLAAQGPTVDQASASLVAAHAASTAARAPYLPTISLSYSRNRSAPNNSFALFPADSLYSYSGQLRFTLSYPLFNQLNREQSVVEADVAETNAGATLRDAQLAAQQNLVQYLGALRTAQQQVQIQTVSVTAAEEDLRVQQQRYQLGASTLLDVLTSETALIQARAALIQARFNYRTAKAQLEALVGRNL